MQDIYSILIEVLSYSAYWEVSTSIFAKMFTFSSFRKIWQYLQQIGFEVNVVPFEQWKRNVHETASQYDNLKPLVQLLSTRLKYFTKKNMKFISYLLLVRLQDK